MPLHLIKLCVGCDSVADLEDWIKQKLKEKKRRGQKAEHIHTTRMVPKRGLVDIVGDHQDGEQPLLRQLLDEAVKSARPLPRRP